MNGPIKNPNKLAYTRYENFFNLYQDDDGFLFYNLLKNINIIPANETSVEEEYVVKPKDTWIFISYKYYNNMNLWWLVCEYNQIKDPTKMPEPGTKLKLLKNEYLSIILDELNRQVKR
jgi:nucleoid-associated protein YgaU